jgi:hypothetical protein
MAVAMKIKVKTTNKINCLFSPTAQKIKEEDETNFHFSNFDNAAKTCNKPRAPPPPPSAQIYKYTFF